MNFFDKRLAMVVAWLGLMMIFSGTAFPADLPYWLRVKPVPARLQHG